MTSSSDSEVDTIIYDDSDGDIESKTDEFNAIKDMFDKVSFTENQYTKFIVMCEEKKDKLVVKRRTKLINKKISEIDIDEIIKLNKIDEKNIIQCKKEIKRFLDGITITNASSLINYYGDMGDYESKSYIDFLFEKYTIMLEYKINEINGCSTRVNSTIRYTKTNKNENEKIDISNLILVLKLNISEKIICDIFDEIYRGLEHCDNYGYGYSIDWWKAEKGISFDD